MTPVWGNKPAPAAHWVSPTPEITVGRRQLSNLQKYRSKFLQGL